MSTTATTALERNGGGPLEFRKPNLSLLQGPGITD